MTMQENNLPHGVREIGHHKKPFPLVWNPFVARYCKSHVNHFPICSQFDLKRVAYKKKSTNNIKTTK